MIRICPNPRVWNDVYLHLKHYAKVIKCKPPQPPIALILGGGAFTNDIEKKDRWEQTIRWANDNGCVELVNKIPDSDFYSVEKPSTCDAGSVDGPMYRHVDEKDRPSSELRQKSMETLLDSWPEIVGNELSIITRPLAFTGRKARRLLVRAKSGTLPPWGTWSYLSSIESERRVFTRFRAAVNRAIKPHEVDHIDFITDEFTK